MKSLVIVKSVKLSSLAKKKKDRTYEVVRMANHLDLVMENIQQKQYILHTPVRDALP
jgi:hypothetical protein